MLKLCKIYGCINGTLGLHLSRAPWDPYPWVSNVQKGSSAYRAGLRAGDTVLEFNGCDVLGQKIFEIAARLQEHWQSGASYVTVVIWRNKSNTTVGLTANGEVVEYEEDVDNGGEDDYDDGNAHHGINQQSLQKFATCLQHIAQLLECPVCLEVIKPPGWQCCNGHVLCNNCRSRSVKCPVCRVPLGPRGRCLLSDKLFTLLADNFPCDGVKSNKSTPTQQRKCTADYHNHPKMAIATKPCEQQQFQQQIKTKEIKKKFKSLYRQHEQQHQQQQQQQQQQEQQQQRHHSPRQEHKAHQQQNNCQEKLNKNGNKQEAMVAVVVNDVSLVKNVEERVQKQQQEQQQQQQQQLQEQLKKTVQYNCKVPAETNGNKSDTNGSNNNNNSNNYYNNSNWNSNNSNSGSSSNNEADTDNNISLRRKSRTTKVHQHQLNEMKILKSHEQKQLLNNSNSNSNNNNNNNNYYNNSSNIDSNNNESICDNNNNSHNGIALSVKMSSASVNNTVQDSYNINSNNNDNNNMNNNNNNNNNNNSNNVSRELLVKQKLKSNRKTTDYYMFNVDDEQLKTQRQQQQQQQQQESSNNSNNNKITVQSHELEDDEVTIVNNGMPTNKLQQRRQQHQQHQHHQQQQHQRQQQYHNYHCPTGKSCSCSYVKTSGIAMAVTKTSMGVAVCNSNTNNNVSSNNINNAKNNNSKLSTTWMTNGIKLSELDTTAAAVAAPPAHSTMTTTVASCDGLMLSKTTTATTTKLLNVGSLSCKKSWATELSQGNRLPERKLTVIQAQNTITTTPTTGNYSMPTTTIATTAATATNMTYDLQGNQNFAQHNLAKTSQVHNTNFKKQQQQQEQQQQQQQVHEVHQEQQQNDILILPLHTEWQILTHLTREHCLPVLQFYGTYSQKIHVNFMYNKSIVCLNLMEQQQQEQQYAYHQQSCHRHPQELEKDFAINANNLNYENVNNYQMDKFFLACIPLYDSNINAESATATATTATTTTTTSTNKHTETETTIPTEKFAIFLWHLLATDNVAVSATTATATTTTMTTTTAEGISTTAADNAYSVATASTAVQQRTNNIATQCNSTSVDRRHFETIIESQRTGIKWFGRSQSLTKSWCQIEAEGHFLTHEIPAQLKDSDALEIVIRIK